MTARSEHGFTLVELLLAIVIMGTTVGAIGSAVIVGLRTTHLTESRLTHSHDRQMTSAYVVSDIQSAGRVSDDTRVNLDLMRSLCAFSAKTPSFTVSFAWDDGPRENPTKKLAAYLVEPVAGERRQQMKRLYCENGVLVSTVTVAHSLADGSSGTAAEIRCDPSCSDQPETVAITLRDANGDAYQVMAARRTTTTRGAGA